MSEKMIDISGLPGKCSASTIHQLLIENGYDAGKLPEKTFTKYAGIAPRAFWHESLGAAWVNITGKKDNGRWEGDSPHEIRALAKEMNAAADYCDKMNDSRRK